MWKSDSGGTFFLNGRSTKKVSPVKPILQVHILEWEELEGRPTKEDFWPGPFGQSYFGEAYLVESSSGSVFDEP